MATVNMVAADLPLRFHKGDDIDLTITRKVAGSAVDITAYTFEAKILFRGIEQAFTITKTDAANGQFKLSLTDTETARLSNGTWYLKETVSGITRTLCGGQVILFTDGQAAA